MIDKITYEKILENPAVIFKFEASDLLDPTITTFLWDNPHLKNKNVDGDKLVALICDFKEQDKLQEGFKNNDELARFLDNGAPISTSYGTMYIRVINKSSLSDYFYEPFVFIPIMMMASGKIKSNLDNDALLLKDISNFRLIPKEQGNIEFVKEKVKGFYKQFYQLKEYYESNRT